MLVVFVFHIQLFMLSVFLFFHSLSRIVSKFINRDEHFPLLHARLEAFQRENPGRIEGLKFILTARVSIHPQHPVLISQFHDHVNPQPGSYHLTFPRRDRL